MTNPHLSKNILVVTIAVAAGFAGAVPAVHAADEPQHEHAHTMPMEMPKDEHPSMNMTGMLGPYGMTREASGTSWHPDSTPMDGRHLMWGGWGGMLHGYMNAVYAHAGGARGDTDVFLESMFMAMGRRKVGPGTLGVRTMLSLDPLLIGKRGYPLLFQTGETADGQTSLIDRQHPHDLFMELASSYSLPLGANEAVFVYAGLPGEPALGPPTFMHRFSGIDNPDAPLLHHWLDSTHITFGVVTLGYINRDLKLEASTFNGREPDENRYNIETGSLDSWSARVSYNAGVHWSMQGSFGRIRSPEQLEPDVDVDRTTFSVAYNRPLAQGSWQTTLAWGRNEPTGHEATSGYLLESAAAWGSRHTFFARAETVDKDELFREGESLAGRVFRVNKLNVGYIHDFDLGSDLKFGVGVAGSKHFIPEDLAAVYGNDPASYLLFVRIKL